MKKFLNSFLLFCLILLVITGIIECLLLTRLNDYSYKSNFVKENADEIECLLLGNSHIEEGLVPDSMGTGVFNMAISGRYLVYDAALAQMHVPTMHNLKVLVVPYEYFEFYLGRNEPTKAKMDTREELSPTIKCMNYKYMGLRVDGFWYWSEFLNSNEDFMTRFVMQKDQLLHCDSLGYMELKSSNRKPNWKQKGLPDAIDLTKSKDSKLREQLNKDYETLAKVTRDNGVRLVLLSTPMYRTYREMMNKELIEEMASYVHALQEKYPHVEYYNYISDDRFVDDDFQDASHLTEIGARKFSKIVKKEILEKQ